MPVEIRAIEPDEHRAFVDSMTVPFLMPVNDSVVEYEELTHDVDRCFAAFDRGRMVGNCAVLTRNVTVPGAPCPVVDLAAVTSVGVHPTHRRQGILTRMMAAMADQARERGEPLAGLGASEGGIYRRFGYGVATREQRVTVDATRFRLDPPTPTLDLELGVLKTMGPDLAKSLPDLFEQVRRTRPGGVDRREGNWAARLKDLRNGDEPEAMVAAGERGYVVYRYTQQEHRGFHQAVLEAIDLAGVDAEAEAGLWAFLTGVDLVNQVRVNYRPLDDPTPLRLTDPRAWHVTDVMDSLWLRVLDVPATLMARTYDVDASLVLDVTWGGGPDPVVGRWTLECGPDGSTVRPARAGEATDLTLDVAELGSLYLGDVTATALVAARRIGEERPGAARRADATFASPAVAFNATGF